MKHVMVERSYDQPLTEEDFVRYTGKLGPCLSQYQGQWLHSYVSDNRKRLYCIFKAPDAESVRMAFHMAGIAFNRVWPARLLTEETKREIFNPPGTP